MTSPDVDTVRGWARSERDRADRAAELAARHERLMSAEDDDALAAFHRRIAAIHRRIAQRHRTSARLHDRYGDRLATWTGTGRRPAEAAPRFLGVVAAELGSASAGITLVGPNRTVLSMIASDPLASAVQNIEFDLGQGPAYDVTRHGRAVHADAATARRRWPRYSAEVDRLGVRSVAAVPLVEVPLAEESACFGALALFDPSADRPTELLARLTAMADTLTHTMLLADDQAPDGPLLRDQDHRAVTHQAVGMVAARCGCGMDDALALIRAYAFAESEPVDAIAHRIVRRRLRLGEQRPD